MKTTALLFFFCMASLFTVAQEVCVDSTLIDPNALCPAVFMPVCGCNGITYENACLAQVTGGVTDYTDGPCAVDANCISSIQQEWGSVVDCSSEWDPVCGCDGQTYSNACIAFYYGGVTNYSIGPCGATSYCPVIPLYIDFGECDMFMGIANIHGTCTPLSGCGWIGPNGYNYQPFFTDTMEECEQSCGPTACIDTNLIDESVACLTIYDPVCGCDGVTYGNSCEATYWHGVTSYTMGECSGNSVSNWTKPDFRFFPNPTNDVLNVQFDHPAQGTFEVLDMQGKRLLSQRISGLARFTIDLNPLAPGVYACRFQPENGPAFTRMIIRE
jgi:hypothetical protein